MYCLRWTHDENASYERQRDALAAKGYQETFQLVQISVVKVLNGDSTGEVFRDDVQNWYRSLFKPSEQAGILEASQLAGYRNHQAYISGSRQWTPSASVKGDIKPFAEFVLFEMNL